MAESNNAAPPSNGPEVRRLIPCVCHGHTRPVTHLCFSTMNKKGEYQIISSSKDSIPLMRKGDTGDWLGSWIGHQGAVWCTRQSNDWSRAVSAAADYTAHVWDATTGEVLYILRHEHLVVRAVDFCPNSNDHVVSASNDGVLRLWVLSKIGTPTSDTPGGIIKPVHGIYHEGKEKNYSQENASYVWVIGKHRPNKMIKFVLWLGSSKNAPSTNLASIVGPIVTAQENSMYWWRISHIGTPKHDERPWKEYTFDSKITCCERYALDPEYAEASDIGGGMQVLGVAAGKKAVFFGGRDSAQVLKEFNLDWRVSSVAVDVKNRKVLLGQADSTWAVLLDWDTGVEEQTIRSHHGPIHSMAYSPDNKVFATGSEDGTVRLWKNCEGDYGLWVASKSAAETN